MSRTEQPSFPVNLLLAGRKCLVVGGGKAAYWKIKRLQEAKADVEVICPELCEEVAGLVSRPHIRHHPRSFEPRDVEGAMIVFAATDSRLENRQVLESCRAHHILCHCVDGNWSQADFTTPATTRHNGLTVSVSSGGKSCRQSRMVRNSLARHLESMASAELVVVGTDHHHLSLEDREPVHLTDSRYALRGRIMMQLWGVHEFMLLNTCNRVELIAVVSKETSENGILRHMMGFTHLTKGAYYVKCGHHAFEHLCMTTAGMLSQTLGESHIAAQIKEALKVGVHEGWAGNLIQECVSMALRVSKEIKNTTGPHLNSVEIQDLAIRYAQAVRGNLKEKTVMILGTGMLGKELVQAALAKAQRIIWCFHVNRPELPTEWQDSVELRSFNSMKDCMNTADLIISAANAPGHLLHRAHLPFLNQEKAVLLIDLGMPRNIAPDLDRDSPNTSVIDLDSLKYWHRNEPLATEQLLADSRAVIHHQRDLYDKIAGSLEMCTEPARPPNHALSTLFSGV